MFRVARRAAEEADVNDTKWEQYGALAGLVFVILVVVSVFIAGSPPRPDDSIQKIADYYKNHTGAIKTGAFLTGLAAAAFLWFLGSLWSTLRRSEDTRRLATIATGGGIVGLILAVAASALNSSVAIALNSRDSLQFLNPKFIYLLSGVIGGMGNFGVAVLVAATGVAILRTRVFPAWLAGPSLVIALGWLVAGLVVATDSSVIFTVGFVVFLLWLIWILLISFFMFRPQAVAPATPEATAPVPPTTP
jgi:preprotein translocase subunit YajC